MRLERSSDGGRRLLRETIGVVLTGFAFAFLANAVSPRGLSLTRDYFPRGTAAPTNFVASATNGLHVSPTNVAVLSASDRVAERLKADGLNLIQNTDVVRLFRDPRYQQELVVIIDARDDRQYQEGHIPGAYQFDHYYPEKYLPAVLPAALAAEQVVVYCLGGDCEDSEFAALTLKQAGVAAERLFVYPGGMTEWITNGLPVEAGQRNSGDIRSKPVAP